MHSLATPFNSFSHFSKWLPFFWHYTLKGRKKALTHLLIIITVNYIKYSYKPGKLSSELLENNCYGVQARLRAIET